MTAAGDCLPGDVRIVAIVGSGSGCGKTSTACRILRAVPGLGAVKISPREGPAGVEWGPGESGKDTGLFASSGAILVARIFGPRESVAQTWKTIRHRFEKCVGVVIEGTSSIDLPGKRFIVYVDGGRREEGREERNKGLTAISDMTIRVISHYGGSPAAIGADLSHNQRIFDQTSPGENKSGNAEHIACLKAIVTFLGVGSAGDPG